MRLIPYGTLSAAGGGQAAAGFGILRAYQSGKAIKTRAMKSDSSGNFYLGFENSTDYDMVTVKLNSSYAVQWQRNNGRAAGTRDNYIDDIFVDTDSNVYVLGRGSGASDSDYSYFYVKYNSSGTVQWQRYIEGGGSNLGEYDKTSFTDGTNYGIWSKYSISTNRRLGLFGVTSTGTLHQGKQVYTRATNSPDTGGAFWKSGAGYAAFSSITDGTTYWGGFLKFNSSYAPTANARYLLNSLSDSYTPIEITQAGTDNNYAFGYSQISSGTYRNHLVKFNDSLDITWNQALTGVLNNFTANNISTDSSGNVYVTSSSLIIKFDSSGSILWQRKLQFNSADANFDGMFVSGSYVYVWVDRTNLDNSAVESFIFQLPIDGSGTGSTTIGSNTVDYTVYGTTITLASQTMNKTTHSFTDTSAGSTSQTRSATDAAGSLSFEEVLI